MDKKIKVAYCTGFWCTNIGNSFFSMGVEYVLKKILGNEQVTVVSDYQTYTTSYGKRLYPSEKQLEYIQYLDVDFLVLAGPVISRYFLTLWKSVLLSLKARGVGYILLSAGTMKMTPESEQEIKNFFMECPPYILSSRDSHVYRQFGKYAVHAYDGICFSFFTPDVFYPASMSELGDYIISNFDKMGEPKIWVDEGNGLPCSRCFNFDGVDYKILYPRILTHLMSNTDRFTDAMIYALSILPARKHEDWLGNFKIVRVDHRFHPHYRNKIYRQNNSFCADLPYGYLNLYANAKLTLSDRVHACAVTMAFGHSAMLFAKTSRHGLLDRVGADGIDQHPVKLDMEYLNSEKSKMIDWLARVIQGEHE